MCEIADRIRKEGIREGIIKSLQSMIKNANMPLEHAMTILEIPEADRSIYAGEIGKIL